MGAKDVAYEKIEALVNMTADVKEEALDKMMGVKNLSLHKLDGVKDMAYDKVNATLAMKKDMFVGKFDGVKNQTAKSADYKTMWNAKLQGGKKNSTKAL
jgi:hypothetical protein